jgi:hypothetical protein
MPNSGRGRLLALKLLTYSGIAAASILVTGWWYSSRQERPTPNAQELFKQFERQVQEAQNNLDQAFAAAKAAYAKDRDAAEATYRKALSELGKEWRELKAIRATRDYSNFGEAEADDRVKAEDSKPPPKAAEKPAGS